MGTFAARGAYAHLRPIAVAESLRDLRGPISGVVRLPPQLDWSLDPEYDLSDVDQIVWMYSYVLGAALREVDLRDFLDSETLRRLWPALHLTPPVREAWERRFPELAA